MVIFLRKYSSICKSRGDSVCSAAQSTAKRSQVIFSYKLYSKGRFFSRVKSHVERTVPNLSLNIKYKSETCQVKNLTHTLTHIDQSHAAVLRLHLLQRRDQDPETCR